MITIKNTIFLVISAWFLMSVGLPKNLQKKVNKAIKKTFDIERFELQEIEISDKIQDQLVVKIKPSTFYRINTENTLIGYAFVDKAVSKTDQFDYLILLDVNGLIKKIKVLIYREDFGAEIGSKRWLRQFLGKSKNDNLKYGKEIIAISGATISANSMTMAVNNFLRNLVVLYKNNIL